MVDHAPRQYQLSTLCAAVGVKAVTFNTWRNRNGLFPRTQEEKGWKLYSMPEICATYCVLGMTAGGSSTQFAVDAAMALLPRFEAIYRALKADNDSDAALRDVIALVSVVHDPVPGKEIGETASYIDLEFYSPQTPFSKAISGRMAWGTAKVVDLRDVFSDVLRELKELGAESVSSPEETRKQVYLSLAEGLRKLLLENEE